AHASQHKSVSELPARIHRLRLRRVTGATCGGLAHTSDVSHDLGNRSPLGKRGKRVLPDGSPNGSFLQRDVTRPDRNFVVAETNPQRAPYDNPGAVAQMTAPGR